jgi:hypothetical protein
MKLKIIDNKKSKLDEKNNTNHLAVKRLRVSCPPVWHASDSSKLELSSPGQPNDDVLSENEDKKLNMPFQSIVKVGDDQNLCLITSMYNCLRTYEKRFAFSGGNIVNPFDYFLQIMSLYETKETDRAKNGYTTNEMATYLQQLVKDKYIRGYTWKRLKNYSLSQMLCAQKQNFKDKNIVFLGASAVTIQKKHEGPIMAANVDKKIHKRGYINTKIKPAQKKGMPGIHKGIHGIGLQINRMKKVTRDSDSNNHASAIHMDSDGKLLLLDNKNKIVRTADVISCSRVINNIHAALAFDIEI